MLSADEIFKKFSVNDVVKVNYKPDYGTTFFAIVAGFALSDIGEACIVLKEIVHYQEEQKVRVMNPNSRAFVINKV